MKTRIFKRLKLGYRLIPLQKDLKKFRSKESENFGKVWIQGLKQFYVNSSHEQIVKDHLVGMAKTHFLLRRYLYVHLDPIKDSKGIPSLWFAVGLALG